MTVFATFIIAAMFAAPANATRFSVTGTVYDTYNHWCGGDSPFHPTTGWAWTCEDRKQQLYVNGYYTGFTKVTYCYLEWKIGARSQRCVRANVYDGSYGYPAWVIQSAVWWTNS